MAESKKSPVGVVNRPNRPRRRTLDSLELLARSSTTACSDEAASGKASRRSSGSFSVESDTRSMEGCPTPAARGDEPIAAPSRVAAASRVAMESWRLRGSHLARTRWVDRDGLSIYYTCGSDDSNDRVAHKLAPEGVGDVVCAHCRSILSAHSRLSPTCDCERCPIDSKLYSDPDCRVAGAQQTDEDGEGIAGRLLDTRVQDIITEVHVQVNPAQAAPEG
eukprot:scaffold164557_cov31-Tisochrysis_lutea.AAC.2